METCRLEGAARAFEVFCWSKGLSPRTVETYAAAIDKLREFLPCETGDERVVPSRSEAREFVVFLSSSGLSRASVAIHVRSIRAFFSFLFREGMITEDLAASLPVPKAGQKAPVALCESDVRSLLAAARGPTWFDVRNTAMLMLFLDTGLRLAELVGLDVDDVSLNDWRIRIRNGKGSRDRTVFVGRGLHRALRRWLDVRGATRQAAALFVTRSGQRHDLRNVERILGRLTAQAGVTVRVTPHILRHTFAVNYVRHGGDPFTLQRLLGHSDIRTTRIYVEMSGEDLRRAHAKAGPLDQLLAC